jgi:hypothetical protein
MPFFSPFNEAAKRVPCPKSGNVGSIGLLHEGNFTIFAICSPLCLARYIYFNKTLSFRGFCASIY